MVKPDPLQLVEFGAVRHVYDKGELIFKEGAMPRFVYFLAEGMVRVVINNNKGKDLVQGVFFPGDFFGEPPFIIEKAYPSSAYSVNRSSVLRMTQAHFQAYLDGVQGAYSFFLRSLSERIHNKVLTTKIILTPSPEERVLSFLERYKGELVSGERSAVPFTRQEIADFTGLRVETVIRAMGKLRDAGKLEIINRKVYF